MYQRVFGPSLNAPGMRFCCSSRYVASVLLPSCSASSATVTMGRVRCPASYPLVAEASRQKGVVSGAPGSAGDARRSLRRGACGEAEPPSVEVVVDDDCSGGGYACPGNLDLGVDDRDRLTVGDWGLQQEHGSKPWRRGRVGDQADGDAAKPFPRRSRTYRPPREAIAALDPVGLSVEVDDRARGAAESEVGFSTSRRCGVWLPPNSLAEPVMRSRSSTPSLGTRGCRSSPTAVRAA